MPIAIQTARGKLVGQFVVGQRRHQADDAPGDAFGGFRQAVVGVERRVGQLVEAAREAVHVTGTDHSADRGGGDAGIAEFGQAHQSPEICRRSIAWSRCVPVFVIDI